MNDEKDSLELEYELDDPPEKVWRAISIPEFRETWLPNEALAEPHATEVVPGREVKYRLREQDPPHLESDVTFTVLPNGTGGARLRIFHELRLTPPANLNRTPVKLAA